jgi:hypothetical protein
LVTLVSPAGLDQVQGAINSRNNGLLMDDKDVATNILLGMRTKMTLYVPGLEYADDQLGM